GQLVTQGITFAKVAEPKKLKAQLKIAETQAKDVLIGQPASIDTRNGVVEGRVVRIDPAVLNGTVTVDVAREGDAPGGARPDLSVDGVITLDRLKDVLYVGRPAFGQEKSLVGLFRLNEDGDEETRVKVKLGKSSVNTVEILEGLKPGDKVILSDMRAWGADHSVRLNAGTRNECKPQRSAGHQARRGHEGLLHRRGRASCPLGRAPGDP